MSNTGNDSSHAEIKIPQSKKSIENLIKDRIIFGKLALESLLRTGYQYYDIGKYKKTVVSNKSIEFACASAESFMGIEKNLGLILINQC
jgi:hypothetical protein